MTSGPIEIARQRLKDKTRKNPSRIPFNQKRILFAIRDKEDVSVSIFRKYGFRSLY